MLWYIIDGYNVIHKINEVKKSASPRQEFIYYIRRNNLTGSLNNKVTVVFDGGPHYEEFIAEKQFTIMFSQDKTADELIKDRIARAKNKKQIVVVSDDREIREAARREGTQILRTKEFLIRKKKAQKESATPRKQISLSMQEEITEELRKVWLSDEE